MYNLYRLCEDQYQVYSVMNDTVSFEGTRLAVLTFMTFRLGFNPDELEVALLDMLHNDTDSADFGVNGTFIYSFNRKRKTG